MAPSRKSSSGSEGKGKAAGTGLDLIKGIKDLEEKRDDYHRELSVRATQINDLCKMSAALRVMMKKIETGDFTKEDNDAMELPKIYRSKDNGTKDGFEYVRATLSMLRPLITLLFKERMRLFNQVQAITESVTQAASSSQDDDLCEIVKGLDFGSVQSMIGEIEEVD